MILGAHLSPIQLKLVLEYVLRGISTAWLYDDDHLVAPLTKETHLALTETLRALWQQWLLKAVSEFLEYFLSAEGSRPVKDKLSKIKEMKPATTHKESQQVIGLFNFFPLYVRLFSNRDTQLTSVARKDNGWIAGSLPPKSAFRAQSTQTRAHQCPNSSDPRRVWNVLLVQECQSKDWEDLLDSDQLKWRVLL